MSPRITHDLELQTDEHVALGAAPSGPSSTMALRVGGALFAFLLVASFALGQVAPPPSRGKTATQQQHVAPRIPRLEAATGLETRPPMLCANKAPRSTAISEVVALEPEPVRVFTTSMLPSGPPPSAPAIQQPSQPPQPARNPVTGVTTGFLRMPASVSGVLVDGSPHRVAGGALQVSCGWHKIKTPQHPTRPVNVPCGGTAML
jgi:hypothetical protein